MHATGSSDSRECHLILLYGKETSIDVAERMYPVGKQYTHPHTQKHEYISTHTKARIYF